MADSRYYPDQWHEYCRFAQTMREIDHSKWNQFAARYRAAASFQYAEFMKMSQRSVSGYSVGMKLLLSYSAFEYACAASNIDHNLHQILIEDSIKSQVFKKIDKVFGVHTDARRNLRTSITSKKLLSKVDDFFEGRSQNLQPICASLRHMIAHGQWTPTATNTLTRECKLLFEQLSQQLLKGSDQLLGNFVSSMD